MLTSSSRTVRGRLAMCALLGALGCAGTGPARGTPPPVEAAAQTSALQPQPPELRTDEPVRTFEDGGTRFILLPVRVGGEDAYLGRITGVDHPIKGLVLRYDIHIEKLTYKQRVWYTTEYLGRAFWVFRAKDRVGRLSLPTYFRDSKLNEVPTRVKPQELIDLHAEQVRSGAVARYANFDRKAWVEHHERLLKGSFEGVCGDLEMRIDWEQVPDAWLKKHTIWRYCSDGAAGLAKVCERSPDLAPRIASTSLVCRFGAQPGTDPAQPGYSRSSNGVSFAPYGGSGSTMRARKWTFGSALRVVRAEKVLLRAPRGFVLLDATPISAEPKSGKEMVYGGDGTIVYRQLVSGWGQRDHRRSVSTWAGQTIATLEPNGRGGYKLKCGKQRAELAVVTGQEKERILKGLTVKPAKWKRLAHAIARDTRGTYYYVDKVRDEHGGRRYRVFIGTRGQMKLSKLVGVVHDKGGTVFSTKKGRLRLIVDSGGGRAVWIRGKKQVELRRLRIDANFIYGELGVYLGESLGHLCELL